MIQIGLLYVLYIALIVSFIPTDEYTYLKQHEKAVESVFLINECCYDGDTADYAVI